jgi:type II secretory pathway component PulF
LSALAEYSQLLSLLLDCKVPLPEALRLVGQGSRDAELAAASEVIAEDVRHGSPLTDSATRRSTLPQGLRQLLRWAERPQTFSEVLRAASEMFEARARMQSAAIAPFIEPMLIVGLGLSVGFILISLFLPLMKLLNDLS